MGQVLNSSARMTEAVHRAIWRSEDYCEKVEHSDEASSYRRFHTAKVRF